VKPSVVVEDKIYKMDASCEEDIHKLMRYQYAQVPGKNGGPKSH